ncbi:hypothetical protein GF327_10315 [Candidatus Woesearchaeota archaeon]|nr:hypothetical protein [Candidatus Woesearchaeota archaeon]
MKKIWMIVLVLAVAIVLIGLYLIIFSCNFKFGYSNKQGCYVEKSIKTNNYDFCKKSPNPSWCYQDVAIRLEDEDICKRIEHLNFSSTCVTQIAVIKKDETICEKIDGPMLYGCYVEVLNPDQGVLNS